MKSHVCFVNSGSICVNASSEPRLFITYIIYIYVMNSLGTEDGVNVVTTVSRTSMYCSKSGITAHTWMNINMLIYHQHDTLMREREMGEREGERERERERRRGREKERERERS